MYICFFFTICLLLAGAIIYWCEDGGKKGLDHNKTEFKKYISH